MNKEAYKQKIEAELELAQAKLSELKAKAKSKVADTRIEYDKHAAELEHHVTTTRTKLKELADASDDAWESLKGGVETSWNSLSAAMKNAVSKLKD